MNKHENILIIDFGGQYNQLIARRVRECGVYCEVVSYKTTIDEIKNKNPKGIIFTGGPNNVFEENAPKCSPDIFSLGIPILGICYGQQLMSYMLGGTVIAGNVREYGKIEFSHNNTSLLFKNIPKTSACFMSHTNKVETLAEGFISTSSSENCKNASIENPSKNLYGVQFHPEVDHTEFGTKIIKNFLEYICKCSFDWKMDTYSNETIENIKLKVGAGKVLCALSGGVDSSVVAAIVHKAIGDNLTCIFVDHGLLRKNEGDEVMEIFKDKKINVIRVDARDRFLDKLKGISDPETKRKMIGEEFIRVFEDEARKIGTVDYLAQGTIYPDVIESGHGDAVTIKSHHNVGGLPDVVDFKELIEPLRLLFKDEVRRLGLEVGLPPSLVYRQPFPGPGLAVRIIGDITQDKIDILQDADYIFREELEKTEHNSGQYFAVLTNMRSVGVMGDERTYDYTLALRAVTTSDFMTAEWTKIPYDVLEIVSSRIVNEVKGINRIVYDITSKPPATIEWE